MIMLPITNVFVQMALWGKHVKVCSYIAFCIPIYLFAYYTTLLPTHQSIYLQYLFLFLYPATYNTTHQNVYLPAFSSVYIIYCQSKAKLNMLVYRAETMPSKSVHEWRYMCGSHWNVMCRRHALW